ncbi:MAG: hypothetical protein AAF127_12710 [Pseudomonadota bacterium]
MWRAIGPALLFSGTAIGTSHLVQSTRAGAIYGLALFVVILAACVLRYPAFRFGVDYGHAARRSLVAGYRELGAWALVLFATFALPIALIIFAALSSATAGILIAVFDLDWPVQPVAFGVLVASASLLVAGGYDWLDKINRVLVAFLVASTLVVTALVLPKVDWGTLGNTAWVAEPKALLFVVALVGFMPNALDVSVASSMWQAEAERDEAAHASTSLKEARIAFFGGYALTVFLALCFCIIGAGVMNANGVVPETSAPGFARQIISLYSSTLGGGAAVLAAIAALSVMVTTVLAAVDIGGRFVTALWQQASGDESEASFKTVYRLALVGGVLASGVILFGLPGSFTALLDLATSASFVFAPIVATLNHLVMTRCALDEDARPSAAMRSLNILAIILMASLAAVYFAL